MAELYRPSESHSGYRDALNAMGLSEKPMGMRWISAGETALTRPTPMAVPFSETRYIDPAEPDAIGFRFSAPRGVRIRVSIETEVRNYFAEVFRAPDPEEEARDDGTGPEPVAERPGEGKERPDDAADIVFAPRRQAEYVLRIQPELLEGGRFTVTVTAEAALSWPVEGTDRRSIISVFGDGRDAGSRVHHGIDIIAPRGTSVLAAAPGSIMRVGVRDRGGNVVTLDVPELGIRIYYAHLHEHKTVTGASVEPGDVIATVGNTGNAITTPPHLHIGIYDDSWRRPLDPWYFLVPPRRDYEPVPELPRELGQWVFSGARGTRAREHPAAISGYRLSPSRFDATGDRLDPLRLPPLSLPEGPVLAADLVPGTPVRLLGARAGYVYVGLPNGERAYLPVGGIRSPLSPAEELQLAEPAEVLSAPAEGALALGRLPAGAKLTVQGRYASFGLVPFGERQGWISLSES